MKKIYAALLFALIGTHVMAQTASAVVFSENGEKFTLTLNGEKQNATPQSNVKMSNLTSDYYQARVDFEDATLPDFSNNNFQVLKGAETTYVIKKNKKGEYVLRWMSQTEPGTTASTPAPASTPSTEVKQIATVDDGDATMHHSADVAVPADEEVETTVVKTTTTTSGKPATKTNGQSENVNMNVNIGGLNMGMNVNVQDSGMNMDMDVEENSSTTVTTTTTKTTTTAKPAPKPAAKPAPAPAPAPKPEVVVVESKGGCMSQMNAASFKSAKSSIESKSFEDSKMTVAKQVTKANCLTVDQIKEVMGLFSFEESKLDYAKYAYDYCYNPGDYFLINDAFTFESSIDDLNKFLESK